MTGPTLTCIRCGKNNSIHRLWCEQCRTPVPYSEQAPAIRKDPRVVQRAELYQHVLKDLERLHSSRKVPDDTYDSIREFYSHQCDVIDQQILEQQQAEAVHRLVVNARHTAHAGRFHDAIGLLRQARTKNHSALPLQEVIAEIIEKNAQQERVLHLSRKVDSLLRESPQFVTAQQLDEAKGRLLDAQRLDPSNSRVAESLTRVNALIIARAARELASQAEPQVNQQEVLVAELVDGPIDRATLQPAPSALMVGKENEAAAASDAVAPSRSFTPNESVALNELATPGESVRRPEPKQPRAAAASFRDEAESQRSPTHRLIDAASQWSSVVKPFLLDNVGWFVGAFLVVAGFVVLIVTFWGSIEQNRVLMHSLVYLSLTVATVMFFFAAYFMRRKYPQLESSSNVLLVIVALLIPLVFAAAMLTSLVPAAPPAATIIQNPR